MSDIETVRACIEGAGRLGVEPFIDGPAALDGLEAELTRLREQIRTFEDDLMSAEDILKENVKLRKWLGRYVRAEGIDAALKEAT